MDIYSITLRDRRITDYVIEQAYLWLYDQINMDSYIAGDRQSEKLLLEIKQAGTITKKTYDIFLKAFLNDPYQYLLVCGRGKKYAGITSPELKNYFLKFNDEVIPVGFVESFFEDDYETQAEIQAFYDAYLKYNIYQFGLNCQSISLSRSETLENIKKVYPGIFKTKFSYHFTNLIKLILVISGLYLCCSFFNNIHIFQCLDQLLTNGYSRTIEENLPAIIANAVFAVILLVKCVHCIRCVVFYIDLVQVRFRIFLYKRSFAAFDANTITNFKEYFEVVNAELASANYCISDEMCEAAPARRHHYLKIVNFNKESVTKILNRMALDKHYKKLSFYYTDDKELAECKKVWKKGIISTILLLIVFAFINVPELNMWIVGLFHSIEEQGFFSAIQEIFQG